MANRAGPMAQLLWDLATDPIFREQFKDNSGQHLALRGFKDARGEEARQAVFGNRKLLLKILREEEVAMNEIWGPRVQDDVTPITGWPPKLLGSQTRRVTFRKPRKK